MLSTDLPTLLLLFVALLCVVLAVWAWLLAVQARRIASQMITHAGNLQKWHQEQVDDLPTASWRSEVDSTLADLKDAVASQGGTLRRLNARNAARARHDKLPDDQADSGDEKDKLRDQARQRGLLK